MALNTAPQDMLGTHWRSSWLAEQVTP
jgi:hypothetical protein